MTTDGHYQIELSCESCHTPFAGVSETACLACHGEALRAVDDSHPKSKFTDPRNADLVKKLDARSCVTCHREHTPDITRAMGVTLPDDYCYICHENVGADRPTHQGLAFDTCGSAGCHNYHDNTALYEDFLVMHANEPRTLAQPRVLLRSSASTVRLQPDPTHSPDAPPSVTVDPALLADWETTSHAAAGVTCMGCHAVEPGPGAAVWLQKPAQQQCATCHVSETAGFRSGKHGMREAAGLTAMRPASARQPMKPAAAERELSCSSCHTPHRFDTRRAAVDACLSCHDDTHSRAYPSSLHARRWSRETEGTAAAGTGVSCATCHLPRVATRENGIDIVRVEHNQNHNLQPNERMGRTVCLNCHGLPFSLDALADPRLIETNFTGTPARRVDSIEMATRRLRASSN